MVLSKMLLLASLCHSGLPGIFPGFPEGFPTRFACGNDKPSIRLHNTSHFADTTLNIYKSSQYRDPPRGSKHIYINIIGNLYMFKQFLFLLIISLYSSKYINITSKGFYPVYGQDLISYFLLQEQQDW
jgi:hypothetical protein